ncbi:hypothetical protein [Psychrobacillus psychrotolerans]|uniref:hypothetical protein n=1 Tax=Psychrobacillus psychrotolerans TaxID=126156 RepID=UPI003314FBBC
MEKEEVTVITADKQELVSVQRTQLSLADSVDTFSLGLSMYLEQLELPTENVLVNPDQRMDVIDNLPRVVSYLSTQQKGESLYISKFIAACGAGLFDAALNFLWNETVTNLRKKVIRFDMDYFINSVVTDAKRRETFKGEDDLRKLDEWELIKGCKDTGIITEIGYKHLDYIRDMRNHASAAHPNHNDLDGFQLVSWLQTCIKEVLAKEPEGPVLEIKRLLINLRTVEISQTDLPPIEANIQKLPMDLIDSTIRAVFGMYTDPTLSATVRNNLKLVLPSLWYSCSVESKNNLGLKYAVFSANAELERKKLAHEFLKIVEGLSFLPKEQIAAEMDQVLENLLTVHNGFNNFHSEPPYARLLQSYIPQNGIIPEQVNFTYVKVLTMCSIGNGYGVSSAADVYYQDLMGRFLEEQIIEFVKLLQDSDMRSRLQFSTCSVNYKELAVNFLPKVTRIPLKKILEVITNSNSKVLYKLYLQSDIQDAFKQL